MAVLAITPAEVKLGPGKHTIKKSEKAGVAVDAGEIGYFDDAAKSWKLGSSNALATAKVTGMFLNGGAADQPVDVCTKGKVNVGASAAIHEGGTYIVAPTDGKVLEADDALHIAGKFTTFVGVGEAANIMDINPTISDTALT